MLDALDLSQIINTPTRRNDNTHNLRDLIITNNTDIINDSGILSSFSNLDHFPVCITLDIKIPTRTSATKERQIWDYENTDLSLLTQTLIQTNWDDVLNLDVHEATEQFTDTVLTAESQAILRFDQRPLAPKITT